MNSAEPVGPRGFTVPRSHVTLAHNFITLLGPLFRSGNQNIWAQMKQNESFAEVFYSQTTRTQTNVMLATRRTFFNNAPKY